MSMTHFFYFIQFKEREIKKTKQHQKEPVTKTRWRENKKEGES